MKTVCGRFKEIGDSILNVFCCELLRVYLQNKQRVSWLAKLLNKSCDSVGCAALCARERTWVCAIIINREISICKYFSRIITITRGDMCAVLVELISSSLA